MPYLDNCQYEENYDAGKHTYTFKGPCVFCGKPHSVTVDGAGLYRYNQGEYIQRAFPTLPSGDREFLISGVCPSCFDLNFAEEAE